jgi:hypothetical protein
MEAMELVQKGSSFRASRAIGAMFFSLFGGVWIAIWAVQSFGVRLELCLPIALIALGIFALAWRRFQENKQAHAEEANTPEKQKADRVFNIVNAGQWVLVLLAINILKNTGHASWTMPAIVGIVGAHFLPLAHVFKYAPHYLTGVVIMLWGFGYAFLTPAGLNSPIVFLGTGLILWVSALYGLFARPHTS